MGFFWRNSSGSDEKDFDKAIRQLVAKHMPETPFMEGDDGRLYVGSTSMDVTNLRRVWCEMERVERMPWLEAAVFDLSQDQRAAS